MRRYINSYLFLFLFSGSLIAIDQWTKELVRLYIPLGGSWMPVEWLQPYARIVHWYNTGAAFGLFKNGSIFFATLAIVVIILVIYYFPRVPGNDWTFRVAMSMQLAGAAGNLIDRIRFEGRVTDFISIGKFAVFNFADGCITIGCIILLLGAWIKDRTQKPGKHENPNESTDLPTSGNGVQIE
jgi:signal peptidase II